MSNNEKPYDLNQHRLNLWQGVIVMMKSDNHTELKSCVDTLFSIERFWAFPGPEVLKKLSEYIENKQKQLAYNLAFNVIENIKGPRSKRFHPFLSNLDILDGVKFQHHEMAHSKSLTRPSKKPCVEILILHPDPKNYYHLYKNALTSQQSSHDEFIYEIIFVSNLPDAATAIYSNSNIVACICLSFNSVHSPCEFSNECFSTINIIINSNDKKDEALRLREIASLLRPSIDCYYLSEIPLTSLPKEYFEKFNRVFYLDFSFKDLHFAILSGLRERLLTPFFTALRSYSEQPKTVFHALPISRASSLEKSLWTKDFYDFYGRGVFDGETSSTQGGMDSLLSPQGAIKNAQEKASRSFGADKTFFVTNGTSTSNKIVIQANLKPGDIVFVSSDCHKSIPYGLVLAGADVFFMQTDAVLEHDLYGGVSLELIKSKMNELKSLGELHRLKQIILTNSTFDGLLYDVETYMIEILSIKADIIFHWDEAWLAHSHYHPMYLTRHSMGIGRKLIKKFKTKEYAKEYESSPNKLPDPNKVKIRLYATQSTHKTLSSFRQGSMIHIIDEEFNQDTFLDAFYANTSTSPSYQILASLDVARRQMEVEGYSLLQKSIQLAIFLKNKIATDSIISKVFRVLNINDFCPSLDNRHKKSSKKINKFELNDTLTELNRKGMAIDPTRLTIDISRTGISGNQFRKLLIDRYNIQVNKTSKYTVLFIVGIGTSEENIKYLIRTLIEIVDRLSLKKKMNPDIQKRDSMPQERQYHDRYLSKQGSGISSDISISNLRLAYYDAFEKDYVEYILIDTSTLLRAESGETWISALFVTHYPPGFPILVPGQVINYKILFHLSKIINEEIHGYNCERGLKIFNSKILGR